MRTLVASPSICLDCIAFDRMLVIGDTTGPGYVEETQYATRDSLGNYWLGQRNTIKVFDSTGLFVTEIGRAGRGPMEFGHPAPLHTDRSGRVHVLDASNQRVTVVGPDFTLYAEHSLPGPAHTATVLRDDGRYAINLWVPSADRIGLPLHIVEQGEVSHSFGAGDDERTRPQTQAARRRLTTDPVGRIISAHQDAYVIEAWTDAGRRITGLRGPPLNPASRVRGPWTVDNPPPNTIWDIQIDTRGRLWVLRWQVKDDWIDQMVEEVRPNGQVALRPKDESLHSIFFTRIDVIDLDGGTIIARTDRNELAVAFLADNVVFGTHTTENGIPQVVVWRVRLQIP